MSRFDPLDVMRVPLQGINLVEANAGTGKTYNIVATFARLLLETSLTVDQILVVSFTEAATAELREKIRERLRGLLRALEAGHGSADDDAFIASITDRETAVRCITRALQSFDQAAIYTIHAFCQRLLADSAFEAGLPLQAELITDDGYLRRQLVEDFWHAEAARGTSGWVKMMMERASPGTLMQQLGKHLGKPRLYSVLPVAADSDAAEQEYLAAAAAARRRWRDCRSQVREMLVRHPGLYVKLSRKLDALFAAADAWAGGSEPEWKQLEWMTAGELVSRTKKGFDPPQHEFFDDLDQVFCLYKEAAREYRRRLANLRLRLLAFAQRELPQRKLQRRVRHFDDLLREVYEVLHSSRRDTLIHALRGQYGAALIDEFQDTDRLQFAIFSTLFGDGSLPVFFVGDPKQAIYAFRGADVYAYLDAREHADRRYRLDRNYRSTPELVNAVNAVFAGSANPFVIDSIGFSPSRAARSMPGLSLDGVAQPALRWWYLPVKGDGRWSKSEAEQEVAAAVASEIAQLLDVTVDGKASYGDGQKLRPRDIAVLVNTNRQGTCMREALARRGVDCMQRSTENVFGTLEADELFVVLRAVVEPSRHALVRAALATRMLGYTADRIAALDDDEQHWQELLDLFAGYPQLWRQHGFVRMFRRLCRDFGVEKRLLSWQNGQRSHANHSHLAELLQRESVRHHGRLDKVVEWMRSQQRALSTDDDTLLLRLESDENLVNIITIHLSKGLQFPVVYCPFLWSTNSRKRSNPVIEFHDADNQPVLDLGGGDEESSFHQAGLERLAERVRLAYVAMTRAEIACNVVWGRVNTGDEAGLTWLLHGGSDPEQTRLPATDDELVARLQQFAGSHVVVEPLPPATDHRLQREAPAGSSLRPREMPRKVPRGWRVSSFSALTRDAVEEPYDYDAVFSHGEQTEQEPEGIFAFPRGARAGRCMHHLFENISFAARPDDILPVARQALGGHGFDVQLAPDLVSMAVNVLSTPLDAQNMRLCEVTDARRVCEMEFYFPLEPLNSPGLAAALAAFARGRPMEQRLERLDFSVSGGFMHGYIDLVFEHRGCYYLADYKSNWLGNSARDYGPPALATEIARHDYYLQYLIYSIALHRHLRRCVPGYEYERHFGGAFYLFLRGMRPQSGPRLGVYADRPDMHLMAQLERLFCGDGSG